MVRNGVVAKQIVTEQWEGFKLGGKLACVSANDEVTSSTNLARSPFTCEPHCELCLKIGVQWGASDGCRLAPDNHAPPRRFGVCRAGEVMHVVRTI